MAGLFALSVDPQTYKGNFLDDLFLGTFYQQNLGEEYCGLSTYDRGQEIEIQTHHGMFFPSFEGKLAGLEGTEGIGYCGPDREPFRTVSKIGELHICFSGNIINLSELVEEFKSFGHTFEREDDIEIIAKLIAQGKDVVDGIKKVAEKIKGAYSLLVLTKKGIYAARCPSAQWPLVIGRKLIGRKQVAVAVASQSGGFNNSSFKLVRDLQPGEIVFIKNGHYRKKAIIPSAEVTEKVKICSFHLVYTGFPNARFEGIPASLVRKRLGAALARRDIKRGFIPHLVTYIPDSGKSHAFGYHQEFCRQMMLRNIDRMPLLDEVLLKWPYAGRSFTPPTQEARDRMAFIKMLNSGESLKQLLEALEGVAEFLGIELKKLILVVCDDSIVRGTQSKEKLIPKIKALGIKEIHLRISNPELLSHCPWGKTTKKGEVLASRLPEIKDRIRFLGVKSLEYNTIEDLVQAIGLPPDQLCVDCDLPPKE